ncbi:MAG: hypothetical protein VX762_02180 [Bacteroidota bacterium]|nr:hypothetical protein [Bacteroidota bacterium]
MKEGLIKIYERVITFYHNKIAFSKIGDIISTFESFRKEKGVINSDLEYSVCGDKVDVKFLISTQTQGLILYNKGILIQLLKEKGFYGITQNDDLYFTFYITGLHGKIISFRLDNNKIKDVTTRIKGLSKGIHQIDFIDDDLYVTNTYQNSILVYQDMQQKQELHWKQHDKIIYPNGKIKKGRASNNYNHFNSIFRFKDNIYLIAHNETKKTKRVSEIYTLSLNNHKTIIKEKINGSNCHNIYKDNNNYMYCKSLEGTLTINNKDVIFHKNKFTRGLSVSDKYIILGGSEVNLKREERKNTNGDIYLYNSDFELAQTISIKNTQIQEIRQIDQDEKTFSNYKYNK